MFELKESIFSGFNNKISGGYGCFETPSGKVNYLQVTARITAEGVTLSDELAGKLVPVREILDTKEMNFGQLLQRDLDDYRVADKLVKYILKGNDIGPAYFPPIQAMLLPFKVSDSNLKPEPGNSFGDIVDVPVDQDEYGMFWKGYQAGESYRFEKLSYQNGKPAPIREGKLSWHDKRAKLVVIDGQHRAMAMLAIYRTLHKAWKGTGSQYRHFYEHEIESLLEGNERAKKMLTDGIEYPVTITWFDEGTNHHEAARKLFVDVNKNAKPPTKSRLILLGDNELKDIFSRTILNELRLKESKLPIYAVEYDYSSNANNTQAGKWSALLNIEMLKQMINLSVWGPNKYIKKTAEKIGAGRNNKEMMDTRFRRQMGVDSWYPDEYTSKNGEVYSRSKLGNEYFPREKITEFEAKFSEGWGKRIITILSEFLPYKSHCNALNSLGSSWVDADNEATLAREAIFEGVGLFWTLREAYEHWSPKQDEDMIPDTVKAWKYINKKETEFYQARCKGYFGANDTKGYIQDMFSKYNSYACMLGLVGAIASISEKLGSERKSSDDLALRFVHTLNAWLENGKDNRKYFLVSQSRYSHTFNQLSKLDQPVWIYFRYFWFEVAKHAYDTGITLLSEDENKYIAEELPKMRDLYFNEVIYPEQYKAKAKISDNEGEELEKEVRDSSVKKYNIILNRWFDASWTQ